MRPSQGFGSQLSAPYYDGMLTLGDRLFAGNKVVSRYIERLERDVYELTRAIMYEDMLGPDHQGPVYAEKLTSLLEEQFLLRPLQISAPVSFSVRGVRQSYGTKAGDRISGHLAEARVPYTGSMSLWRVRPETGFVFPFRGRKTDKTMTLLTLVENEDLRGFAQEVRSALDAARPAVRRFDKTVEVINSHVRQKIDLVVSTF